MCVYVEWVLALSCKSLLTSMIRMLRFLELYICFTRFRSSIALSISNWLPHPHVRTGTYLANFPPQPSFRACAPQPDIVRNEVKYA